MWNSLLKSAQAFEIYPVYCRDIVLNRQTLIFLVFS